MSVVGVVLPDELAYVLDLIGVAWPNVDEDDYREMATSLRDFADDIDGGAMDAHTAVQELLGANAGAAMDAFEAHWGKVRGTHLANLAEAARMGAVALDGVAIAIEVAKGAAIVQLGILAVEIAATIASAPVTLGLSSFAGAAATQATRMIVKKIFREVINQVVDQLMSIATAPIYAALESMAADLVIQVGSNALGLQKGVDLGRTADAGKEGFGEGVDGARKQADSFTLASAGGGGGGGGGGAGGGGGGAGGGSHFQSDGDSFDRIDTRLDGITGSLQSRSKGHMGRARTAKGRTGGRGELAEHIMPIATKIVDGIGEAAEKAVAHVRGDMRKGLQQMHRNHRDNDDRIAGDLDRIAKGGRNDPKGPDAGTTLDSTRGGPGGRGRPGKGDPSLAGAGRGGQSTGGNGSCRTAGDPVDVVSGQMITSTTDLVMRGLLPLVLRRAYASGYVGGQLYGPGWSSTLDQRVEIDVTGVHYAGDDAQILHYPFPAESGQAVYPDSGARWPLTWDHETDTVRIEDPDRGWTRHFDGSPVTPGLIGGTRPVSALSDRNGHRVDFVRDEDGVPTEVRHTCGYRVAVDTVATAAGPRVEGLRLLDGPGLGPGTAVVGYRYYPDGRLAGITDSSGLPYVYEYDDAGRITRWIDRNGESYEYLYDDDGRVVRGVGDDGNLSAVFTYDTARRITTVTDSLGHATEYHYDEGERVFRTVDPLGNARITGYDALGRVTARTDEINRTTTFDLDGHGDPVRITEPDGSTVEMQYTELRQIAAVRRGATLVAAFTYDGNGNLLTTTDAAGARTVREYDAQGRLRSVTDPLGQTRHMETDAAGLITAATDGLGQTARVMYDAFGRRLAFTDPLGATTRFVRRLEGEITERVHPDGSRERWTYDAEGNVVGHEDQAGAVTRFRIGPFGRLAGLVAPDGEEQRFTYDTELRLLSVSTNGAAWHYGYDAAGHIVSETDLNGRRLSYVHDGADQLLEITDSAGRTTGFSYDALGQLTERRNHDGSTTRLGYDARGLLTRVDGRDSLVEYAHDAVGRVVSDTVDGRTTTYTYDALGRCTSRTTPSGITSTWTYDANNQHTGLAGPLGALTFTYDASGRETARFLGAGAALTQAWDVCNRLSAQSIWSYDATADPGDAYANLQERTYGYRADGMPAVVEDKLRGRREYELSPAGRVTRVSGRSWTERYAYDRLGNITYAEDSRVPDGATAGERAYTGSLLRSAGRTHYEYDDRGRVVRTLVRTLSGRRREWRYRWDEEDRLIGVDTPDRGSWTYRYDPLGRRVAKQRVEERDGGQAVVVEESLFVWEGARIVEQHSSLADGSRRTLTWDWEPGTWKPLSQTERAWRPDDGAQGPVDERFFAIVTDLVDTPSEMVDPGGAVVWSSGTDLWGRRLRHAADDPESCPLGRPGQYHDEESGLEYNHFRYYDPATGRYLSSDPLGLNAGPNPHAYVPNPLYWIDPFGLAKQPSGWGGWYGKLTPANWTDGSDDTRYEVNHIPAKATYLDLGLTTDLKESTGPAIRMEYEDHRNFISTGSSAEADAWRAAQKSLIRQGKFDEAMKMDIDEIRRLHGTKYDAAIKEMVDSLPNNRKFQKYLKDNGWTVRTCLLQ
ncbi:RHS repeat-associated core domain-containing protein [Actinacidiphila glaucinigra]|uniref:RHS repeat-associated core domain-containing protein n=1 Tax=Actinacidiphila glaucinigra TaxID=235986 RepID=UPI0033F6E79D